MWKSYFVGVLASYLTSVIHWLTPKVNSPVSGTSIISLSLFLTYFIAFPLLALKILDTRRSDIDDRVRAALLAASFGLGFLVLWQFVISNYSGYLHMTGLAFYILIYIILIRKTLYKIGPALKTR